MSCLNGLSNAASAVEFFRDERGTEVTACNIDRFIPMMFKRLHGIDASVRMLAGRSSSINYILAPKPVQFTSLHFSDIIFNPNQG